MEGNEGFMDHLPPMIHPLDQPGRESDLESNHELIICDGGPNCPYYNHHQHSEPQQVISSQEDDTPKMQGNNYQHNLDFSGLVVVGHHISQPQIANQDMRFKYEYNNFDNQGGMIMSEPSSDDLMMIEEKSNNTFAAPTNNFGNSVQ